MKESSKSQRISESSKSQNMKESSKSQNMKESSKRNLRISKRENWIACKAVAFGEVS